MNSLAADIAISERTERAVFNERDIGTSDPAFTLEKRLASWDGTAWPTPPPPAILCRRPAFLPRRARGLVEDGQPVLEVPPMVEFGDAFDTAEPDPDPPSADPTANQRLRRPASDRRGEVFSPRFPPPRPGAFTPTTRGPAAGAAGPKSPRRTNCTGATRAAARPRRWRRRLGVGVGVAAALGLAVAAQVGVSGDWLDRLKLTALQYLPGPKPPPGSVDAPAAPSPRVLEAAERAKNGDAEAQLSLAILYAKGDGVAQDYAAAAKWFRAAADRGLMRAQYDLGVLYERGRGVPLDYNQAVAWYRKAAEQGHPLAQYNLAVAHTKGQGARQNFFEAAVWYHRAAAQGVVAAMVNLAISV
jgi:hypothetical protein